MTRTEVRNHNGVIIATIDGLKLTIGPALDPYLDDDNVAMALIEFDRGGITVNQLTITLATVT